jgi:phosphoenolpyruvate carboxylase
MSDAGPLADDLALRRDIRRVVGFLGDTLVRQEGQEVLDLVERVRSGSREDRDATARLLDGLDVEDATRLVRAFVAYFHLANVAEQVHRSRGLMATTEVEAGAGAGGTWLARAVETVRQAGVEPGELARLAARVQVRPVFTAHPTEAARRTTLTHLRRIAELLDRPAADRATATNTPNPPTATNTPNPPTATNTPTATVHPGPGEIEVHSRDDRRLAEAVELLWLTDDLRVAQPEPLDEARNALYYFDEVQREVFDDVLDAWEEALATDAPATPDATDAPAPAPPPSASAPG